MDDGCTTLELLVNCGKCLALSGPWARPSRPLLGRLNECWPNKWCIIVVNGNGLSMITLLRRSLSPGVGVKTI